MMDQPATLLRSLFEAAVAAADPLKRVPAYLPEPPPGKTLVFGAGKASAAMARAVEDNWPGQLSGLVVTRYDYGMVCERIEIVEAAHPVPDKAGRAAAGRMLEMVRGLGPDDLGLALISGGASALLSLPAPGLSLDDKRDINRLLLRSGATISEMNCVRKHLSAIKGGRLAEAAAPARLVSLLISDVPGDDPGVIGSGPTVADDTTFAEARQVLEKYGIDRPAAVVDHLAAAEDETPKPGDAVFEGSRVEVVALPQASLEAAADAARQHGLTPLILGDAIEGEASDVGRRQAELAIQVRQGGGPVSPPAVLISGGETTVTLSGKGRGGRNSEFVLAMALALDGAAGIHAIACDTDGIDGSEDNAGAMIGPETLSRAATAGLDARASLADNDSYSFFDGLGDLVVTGPTYTNVNDFRAVLVLS